MPCVVDYGELCLRDGVVGSAIVQIETSWDELAAASEFVGVVEDLRFEEALERMLVGFTKHRSHVYSP